METPTSKLLAQHGANILLTAAAVHASATLDAFVCWTLAGFATALAFLISNLKEVADYLPVAAVANAGFVFIWMFVTAMASRYVAAAVKAAGAAAKEAVALEGTVKNMDLAVFLSEMLRALPWLLRKLAKEPLDSVSNGDLTAGGRMLIRFTLIQGALSLAHTLLCVLAIFAIVSAINMP